jgi:hypothetical protein
VHALADEAQYHLKGGRSRRRFELAFQPSHPAPAEIIFSNELKGRRGVGEKLLFEIETGLGTQSRRTEPNIQVNRDIRDRGSELSFYGTKIHLGDPVPKYRFSYLASSDVEAKACETL